MPDAYILVTHSNYWDGTKNPSELFVTADPQLTVFHFQETKHEPNQVQ